jgi:TusE/DsrC/DsvC family sulfur relay protein
MTVREIAGHQVNFDEDGFMADPNEWSADIAEALAEEIGIAPLSEGHWKVIEFSRNDFASTGEAPTLRRITKNSGVPTKQLYQLFPKGPAKKVALVSGLGKPTGCI